MATGCLRWDARIGQPVFCGKSKERVEAIHARLVEEIQRAEPRDPEAMAQAVAHIRSLAEDPQQEVIFLGSSGNPYRPGRRMDLYQDERGMVYFVDPEAHRVFQFGPGPNSGIRCDTAPPLKVEALRQRAEAFLHRHVPEWEHLRARSMYSESSKGGQSYIFRWEDPSAAADGEWRPALQVVLCPDGKILSFLNTYLWTNQGSGP